MGNISSPVPSYTMLPFAFPKLSHLHTALDGLCSILPRARQAVRVRIFAGAEPDNFLPSTLLWLARYREDRVAASCVRSQVYYNPNFSSHDQQFLSRSLV